MDKTMESEINLEDFKVQVNKIVHLLNSYSITQRLEAFNYFFTNVNFVFPLFSQEKCLIEPNLKISLILLTSGSNSGGNGAGGGGSGAKETSSCVAEEQELKSPEIPTVVEKDNKESQTAVVRYNFNNLEGRFDISNITPKKLVVNLKRLKVPQDGFVSTGPSDSEDDLPNSVKFFIGDEMKKTMFLPMRDPLELKPVLSIEAAPPSTTSVVKLEAFESPPKKIKLGSESDFIAMTEDSDDDRTTTDDISIDHHVLKREGQIKSEADLKCEEIIKDKSHDETENDEPEEMKDGIWRDGMRLFKCLKCEKVYRKKKSLMCHSHQHHPGWCPLCGKYYGITPADMAEHNREFHIKDHPYICEVCGEAFKRNQQFQVHVEVHIKRDKKAIEAAKVEEDKKKTYNCEICFTEFKGFKCYEKHCHDAHKIEGFMCEQCGAHFKNKFSLQQHKFKVHNKEIECPLCHKIFSVKSNLDRHMLLHSDQKKEYCSTYTQKTVKEFQCDLCEKSFSAKRALQRHQLVHSDDRPFKCSLCSRTFKIKSNLVRHNQLTHKHPSADAKIKRFVKDENGELVQAEGDDDENSPMPPQSQSSTSSVPTLQPVTPKQKTKRKRKVYPAATTTTTATTLDGTNFMDMMTTEMQQYPMQQQQQQQSAQNMSGMIQESNLNQNYGTYSNEQLESSINNILNQSQFQSEYAQNNYNIQPDWSNVPSGVGGGGSNGGNGSAQNNMSAGGYSLVDVNSESIMSQLQLKSDPQRHHHHQQQHHQHHQQIMNIPNADLIHYQDLWNPNGSGGYDHQSHHHHHHHHPPNNTYNNIGSILTNLEMMDNNPTNSIPDGNMTMTAAYHQHHHEGDINQAAVAAAAAAAAAHQHLDQSHLNYDFNSQNHTITDISNTFIKESTNANVAAATVAASVAGTSSAASRTTNPSTVPPTNLKRENNNMNDVMESIDLNQKQIKEMLQNTNENVMLPSLIDYLQHPYQF